MEVIITRWQFAQTELFSVWGDNGSGQLGNTPFLTATTPQIVHGLSSIVAVSGGDNTALHLMLKVEFGLGEIILKENLVMVTTGPPKCQILHLVSALAGVQIVAIDAGAFHNFGT